MDYPKMLYRDGECADHNSWDGSLLVAGLKVETLTVYSEDEELAALEDGWRLKLEAPAPKAEKPAKPA